MYKTLIKNRGIFLLITIAILTIWLFFNDKLVLFIHPRYFIFTVILGAIGLVFGVVSWIVFANNKKEKHEIDNKPKIKNYLYASLSFLVICILTLFTPTGLSTTNISVERVNNFTFNNEEVPNNDLSEWSVKNWSAILKNNLNFDETAEVTLKGFIVPIDKDNYYLTKYVLSCCAIDAQPVAVPVNQQDWQNIAQEGDWVNVKATFIEPTVEGYSKSLKPLNMEKINEPDNPYDY